MKWYFSVVLIYISPLGKAEHHFQCISAICVSLFCQLSVHTLCPFFWWCLIFHVSSRAFFPILAGWTLCLGAETLASGGHLSPFPSFLLYSHILFVSFCFSLLCVSVSVIHPSAPFPSLTSSVSLSLFFSPSFPLSLPMPLLFFLSQQDGGSRIPQFHLPLDFVHCNFFHVHILDLYIIEKVWIMQKQLTVSTETHRMLVLGRGEGSARPWVTN